MADKILKYVAIICVCVTLVSSGIFSGMGIEKQKLKEEGQRETINNIAIVNLDEGIIKDGVKTNFARELIRYPDTNFMGAGLEDARKGIENGKFAAYVIVPATFSQNAASINSVPKKAVLDYAVNPNLRDDIKAEIVYDISNFESILNTNMAYMYVSAVLTEFHKVQDSSYTIMENDKKDLQNLMDIRTDGILSELDYAETARLDNLIENIDLSELYEKNSKAIDEIEEKYDEFTKKGEDEFSVLRETGDTVPEAMDETAQAIAEVDFFSSAGGKLVYEDGFKEFAEAIESYNTELESQKLYAQRMLGQSEEEGTEKPSEPSGQLDTIQMALDNQLEKAKKSVSSNNIVYQESLVKKQKELTDYLEEFKKLFTVSGNDIPNVSGNSIAEHGISSLSGNSVSDNTVSANAIKNIDALIVSVNAIPYPDINIDKESTDISSAVNKFSDGVVRRIGRIKNVSQGTLTSIMENKIFKPIQDKGKTEHSRVADAGKKLDTLMGDYQKKLEEYNPMKYFEMEEVSSRMGSMRENTYNIEDDINRKSDEFLEFVDEVYITADENTVLLEESLSKVYDETAVNITDVIDLAKSGRQKVNEENTVILGDFAKKLAYTRLGSIEYTQAYDFMVKPVSMEKRDVSGRRANIVKDSRLFSYLAIGSALAALLCLLLRLGYWTVQRRSSQNKEEDT